MGVIEVVIRQPAAAVRCRASIDPVSLVPLAYPALAAMDFFGNLSLSLSTIFCLRLGPFATLSVPPSSLYFLSTASLASFNLCSAIGETHTAFSAAIWATVGLEVPAKSQQIQRSQ